MTDAEERVQLNVRVPKTLRTRLREAADQDQHPRGFNGWLLDRLEALVGGNPGPAEALTAASPISPSEDTDEAGLQPVEEPDEDGLVSLDAALAAAGKR